MQTQAATRKRLGYADQVSQVCRNAAPRRHPPAASTSSADAVAIVADKPPRNPDGVQLARFGSRAVVEEGLA
jgi:hypothetical protein